MKRGRAAKPAKPRATRFTILDDKDKAYELLRWVRGKWHQEIDQAKIALAFLKKVKADRDGIRMLGRIHKASDLQREFVAWDFVILLNEEVWRSEDWTDKQKKALLDHELCHVTVSLDKTDAVRTDDKGRTLYRMRRHDIEEFRVIVRRHGCYKADLEEFAAVLLKKIDAPLIAKMEEKPASADPVN